MTLIRKIMLLIGFLGVPIFASAQEKSFEGAEGFGAHATGGRGGVMYHVTHLGDAGPGSLRDAVSQGPRTVVFDVGGYVPLESILHIASDITLNGDTAPGDGVGTRNYEVSLSGSHNIILRHLRIRQGDTGQKQNKKSAVAINRGGNIMLDHLSIEFGRWENIDMTQSRDITVQNSIIGNGIAPQRFGCLCESENVTFSHNLWINNHGRNPKGKGNIQFINNIVYNWQVGGYSLGHSAGKFKHDIIGNYFIAGPVSGDHRAFYEANPNAGVYQTGNYVDYNLNGLLDGTLMTEAEFGNMTPLQSPWAAGTVAPPVAVTIDSARSAYAKVVAGAGCSLHRDSVDTAIVEDLISLGKKGKLLDSQEQMGGFGTLNGVPGGGAATTRASH